jgi:hypothetical protein
MIYYDDGGTYDGPPEHAPGLGVLVVAQHIDGQPSIVYGHDFYWWSGDRWWGADQAGIWDYLHRPGWRKVIFGRTVSNERFAEVMAQAMRDHGLIEG